MKREFLQGLGLESDAVDKVMAEYGKNVNSLKEEVGKHEQLKADYKALEEQQSTANTQIEELKKATGTSEELKSELDKLTKEHEQFKADATKREIAFKNLSDVKTKMNGKIAPDMIELLSSKIDLETLVRNEAGEIVDIDSKITKLTESFPSARISTTVDGNVPTDKTTINEADTSKMSDAEYYAAKQAETKGS